MNNPGFSGKSQDSEANSNANTGEDIPAAFRDTPELAPKGRKRSVGVGNGWCHGICLTCRY